MTNAKFLFIEIPGPPANVGIKSDRPDCYQLSWNSPLNSTATKYEVIYATDLHHSI